MIKYHKSDNGKIIAELYRISYFSGSSNEDKKTNKDNSMIKMIFYLKKISLFIIMILIYQIGFSQKRYSTFIDHDKYLLLKNNRTYIGKDTLVKDFYDNGNLKSNGHYALEENGKISGLKIGVWIEYYPNGVERSQGSYQISSYIDCGVAGLERIFYNYKIGKWEYFSPASELLAKGEYEIITTKIDTRCKGGDDLIFMDIKNNWTIPTEDKKIGLDKIELLTTSIKYEDGFEIKFSLDKKKRKVIITFDQKK